MPNDNQSHITNEAPPRYITPINPLNSIPATQAALGGMSRSRIYELLAKNELEKVKIGASTKITGDSINALILRARAYVANEA
jgi:hypothetical protein